MKILQLTAENVKKLKVVDITPKGNVVQVTGRNGQGKSSILDSIWWALAGEKNVQGVPIHRGAENARIRLDLGDMVVERKFGKGEGLTVRNKTGAAAGTEDKKLPKYDSPQAILDALLGRLSFDPLEFSRKSPREQYEDLKAIAKIEVDIDALAGANAADFKRRTDVNRDAKAAWATVDTTIPEKPTETVDENAILDKIQQAAEHNSSIERGKAMAERFKRDAAEKRAEADRAIQRAADTVSNGETLVADFEQRIATLRREAKETAERYTKHADKLRAEANDLEASIENDPVEPIDVSALRTDLDIAKQANAIVAKRQARDRVKQAAEQLDAEAKRITSQIAEREKTIREAIERAEMPIAGLSLSEGTVTLAGFPFDQASDAEKLRASVAIAMAANPTLRVIRIRNASLLDDDGFALLAELAKEKDYQVWCERVDSSGKIGIVMEDGEVVADHQEALELA